MQSEGQPYLPALALDLIGRELAGRDTASLALVDKYTHAALAPQLKVFRELFRQQVLRLAAPVQRARTPMEFRDAITALSESREQGKSHIVAAMGAAGECIGNLPKIERPLFFAVAREIAPQLPQPHGEALRIGLLEQLHVLPPVWVATEIHAGLAWSKELPEARRGGPLAALSRGICHFPNPGGRKLMMEWVCEATAKLPPEYREEPMAALRELVHHLPEDQWQAASERIRSLGKSAEDGAPAATPRSGGT